MTVTLIAAMDRNRVIGAVGGGLPWHLPEESAAYRERTKGAWVLLGRVTFEEMNGWFVDQKPVLLTTRVNYRSHTPAVIVSDVEGAVRQACERGAEDLIVLGGARVFTSTLPWADRMILSRIEESYAPGPRFPAWEASEWERVEAEAFPAGSARLTGWTVEHWWRKTEAGNNPLARGKKA